MKVDVEHKIENKGLEPQAPDDSESCIHFQGGIPGFPGITNYFLIEYEGEQAFFRLQAADEPDLGFLVIDPFLFAPDYQPKFSKTDLESLEITDPKSMVILSIVNLPKDNPRAMTANLMAPLVINSKLRKGRQIVLSNSNYAIRESIMK